MDLNSTNANAMSSRRKVLYSMVASTCQEAGFTSADNYVLDILLQIFQSFLSELSYETKQFCEHSGRTEPLPGDVFMALIEMGIDISTLPAYAMKQNRVMVPSPQKVPKQVPPNILQTGQKKQLNPNIPDYYPTFPDAHSYISTQTFKQPITEYETLREKSSSHKRDVERALTRFMARTFSSTYSYSLFPDEQLSHLFPLIGLKPDNVPYLSAMLPKDQIWDQDSINNINRHLLEAKNLKSSDEIKLNELFDNIKEPVDDDINSNEAEMAESPFLRPPKIVDNFDNYSRN